MSGRRDSLATRRAVFDDHGGEMRFWLAWVQDEIDGPVRHWLREQARRDPALRQDIDSADAAGARRDVASALEATGYLTPKAARASAPRPAAPEDADDVTNIVLQGTPAARRPGAAAAARGVGSAPPPEAGAGDEPRHVLRRALDQLTRDERA